MNVLAGSQKEQKPKKSKGKEYWKEYNQRPERKEYQRKLVARKRAEQKKPKTKEPVINPESRHGKYLDPNYGKKWMAQKRARDEGLTNASRMADEFDTQSPDYLRAQISITNLEKLRGQGKEFPLARLKKFLLRQNDNFWQAFEKLLSHNRLQYLYDNKHLRLPLTLTTLHKWKDEKKPVKLSTSSPKTPSPFDYYLIREFWYEPLNNRLWWQGREILNKKVNGRGKYTFFWKNSPESQSHIYLEIAPEKNYYLRVYYQEKRGDEFRHYQSYFTCKDHHPVNLRFYSFHKTKKQRKSIPSLETQFLTSNQIKIEN